ncbi:MAG: hypothetical protein VB049_03650 [Candidatus Pelethousia sp.]|nr:hypothetical protein [Candidatus Pelethousia sp.]
MFKKRPDAKTIIAILLAITLAGSIVYSAMCLAMAPETGADESVRVRSDYILMLSQCCLGLLVMFVPSVLQRRWTWPIPDFMHILYFIFLYCAIYLGEVRNFYYLVPNWDTWLHTFSGGMLGALGFVVVDQLNEVRGVPVKLGPKFIAIFALCFAMTVGALWEIYEFTFDGLLGLNMQKFRLENGVELVGRAALRDTMKDLIVDLVGALLVVGTGYIGARRKDKARREAERSR